MDGSTACVGTACVWEEGEACTNWLVMAQGSESRIHGLGVEVLGSRDQGQGFTFWGLGIRVKGLEPNNLTSMFDG